MGRSPDTLDPRDLLPFLEDLGCRGTCRVAFSGGPDSTALLLALVELRDAWPVPVTALHVNHGVLEQADSWEAHCRAVCDTLNIPFDATAPPGGVLPEGSPEERLRAWRYAEFERALGPEDVLCMAHHLEDQAETLLLALLRGSGPTGLAGMPAVRPLGSGRLARPLLHTPRAALAAFLAERDASFIEDPSNRDSSMDRNYLRRAVMPVLRKRWPRVDRSFVTSAGHCAEASDLLAMASKLALAGRRPAPGLLDLHGLTDDPPALKAVLRYWLDACGTTPLPRARLEALVTQLRSARPDSRIQAAWNGHTLRHHRERLWLDSPADTPCAEAAQWDGLRPIELGGASGRLELAPATAVGPYRVGPRRGGERFRALPGGNSRRLKDWFSQIALPPWFRRAVPLLLDGDRAVAAGDVVFDRELRKQLQTAGTTLRWRPSDSGLAYAWEECRRARLQLE